jgi:hypothetical protein
MTLLPPDVQAWLDQEDQRAARIIRQHGVYIEYVHGDPAHRSTPFAYTVGLFGLTHPELLVFGVTPESACDILNRLAAHVRAGGNLVPGQEIALEGGTTRMILEEVSTPGDVVYTANRYYERPSEASVPVLQLTYTDDEGRYPWQKGYAWPEWLQPRPGEFHA